MIANIKHNQQGFTLIELIVTIVILGIAIPSLISVIALASLNSSKNGVLEKAVTIAEYKMEEFVQYKEANWDWYKNLNYFQSTESLDDGYTREATVKGISGWGNAGVDAYEISVTVTHSLLPNGYKLTTRFTIYH